MAASDFAESRIGVAQGETKLLATFITTCCLTAKICMTHTLKLLCMKPKCAPQITHLFHT